MHRKIIFLSLLIFISLLSSCSQEDLIHAIADKTTVEKAKEYVLFLQNSSVSDVKKELPSNVAQSTSDQKIKKVLSRIPDGKPDNVKLMGYQSNTTPKNTRTNVSFQYKYGQEFLAITIRLAHKQEGEYELVGFNVRRLQGDLRKKHAFSLADAGLVHFLVLTGAILVPLFMLLTALIAYKLSGLEWRWAWILFIVVGFGRISFNWTTGAIDFNPFSFQILGTGFFTSGPYSPWLFHVAFPVGAVLFWLLKYDRIKAYWKGEEEDENDGVRKDDEKEVNEKGVLTDQDDTKNEEDQVDQSKQEFP